MAEVTVLMFRVVKSNQLLAKIAAFLVSIGRLLCLTFLYRWRFLNNISLDWVLTLTTQPSISNHSDSLDVMSDQSGKQEMTLPCIILLWDVTGESSFSMAASFQT